MAETMITFASFSLELLSPLHLGSRRAGVVAQTHRHAPGHLFTHALAAAVGSRRGAAPDAFSTALEEISRRFRFGPAFFMRGTERLDDDAVERELLASSHHVTIDNGSRSAVESALFEVEFIQCIRDSGVRLCGGVWHEDGDFIDGRPLREWLSEIRLGGEQKAGLGRLRCDGWLSEATEYQGVGSVGPAGVQVAAGSRLPGAALDGVTAAPLQPWLGRRHDAKSGFGRRLSQAALVRLNGRVDTASVFLPSASEPGLGCWKVVKQ